jgi:hypothetical protein
MNCYYCHSELLEDFLGTCCPNEKCESIDGITKLVISNQTKRWYKNGKLHKENGPAIEYPNGIKHWCRNGQTHRENGPAVVNSDGSKEYWLNDRRIIQ